MTQIYGPCTPVACESPSRRRLSVSQHTSFGQLVCLTVGSTTELPRIIEPVVAAMTEYGFSDKNLFGMRLALEEALVNAIKHGHRGDTRLVVRVHYQVTPKQALVTVEDQGPGFDPGSVADPLAAENLERPCGRGLLLMRHYLSWLRYNERGNAVTLCCRRSVG
ncbi:MAG TPA: ATP-binding protein [Gemmataceae bacterium]